MTSSFGARSRTVRQRGTMAHICLTPDSGETLNEHPTVIWLLPRDKQFAIYIRAERVSEFCEHRRRYQQMAGKSISDFFDSVLPDAFESHYDTRPVRCDGQGGDSRDPVNFHKCAATRNG